MAEGGNRQSFSMRSDDEELFEGEGHLESKTSAPTSKKQYPCPVDTCKKKAYTSRQYLRFHLEKNHPELKLKPWSKCEICRETFKFKLSFRAHSRRDCEPKLKPSSGVRIRVVEKKNTICFDCEPKKIFENKEKLEEHISLMHLEKYRCPICKKYLSSEKGVKNHNGLVHKYNKKKSVCSQCNREDNDPRAHYTHMMNEHGYSCTFCKKIFFNQIFFYRHCLYSHSRGKEAVASKVCFFCHEELSSRFDWVTHVRLVHPGAYPFYCYQCKFYFKTKNDLDKHEKNNHECNLISCVGCREEFKNYSDLDIHYFEDHYDLFCVICGEMFLTLNELEDHFLENHEYICNTCNEVFPNKKDLQNHFVTHRNIKIFQCLRFLCREEFKNKEELNNHFETHDDSICVLCDYDFRSHELLNEHMKERHLIWCHHLGCEDYFFTEENLCEHLKQHEDLTCEKCSSDQDPPLSFNSENDWRKHLEDHRKLRLSKEDRKEQDKRKKYQCSVTDCKKIVDSEEKLKAHSESHYKFKCDRCNRIFKTSYDQRKHILQQQRNCLWSNCNQMKDNYTEVRDHVLDDHIPDCCSQCKEYFKTKHDKTLHKCQKQEKFKCNRFDCRRSFCSYRELKMHLDFHNKFTCNIGECEYTCATVEQFNNHNLKHKTTCKWYQCHKKCENIFDLREHVTTDHFPYICCVCNVKFTSDKDLKDHICSKPMHKCKFPQCAKIFKNLTEKLQHEDVHEELLQRKRRESLKRRSDSQIKALTKELGIKARIKSSSMEVSPPGTESIVSSRTSEYSVESVIESVNISPGPSQETSATGESRFETKSQDTSKQFVHECYLCRVTFGKEIDLITHDCVIYRTCNICRKVLNSPEDLNVHRDEHKRIGFSREESATGEHSKI